MDGMQKIIEQHRPLLDWQGVVECPVCCKGVDCMLKLCVNNHGFCIQCAQRLEKCPTCKQKFVKLYQNPPSEEKRQELERQELECLERLELQYLELERFLKSCPYIGEGCKTVEVDREHQTHCEYRPTRCQVEDCQWEGCVKYLINHLEECHAGCLPKTNIDRSVQGSVGFTKSNN